MSALNRRIVVALDLVFYLFLTGVRVVPEPSDTSTTNEGFRDSLFFILPGTRFLQPRRTLET